MQISIGNVGDSDAANDLVFLRASNNVIWYWNQISPGAWTNTGGVLASIVGGDNQVFGLNAASNGQVWKYHVVNGWSAAASPPVGNSIDVGNDADGNSSNDLVFMIDANKKLWVWNQTTWTNTDP